MMLFQNGELDVMSEHSQKMQKEKRPRQYYADWMRSLAIHLVIQVHCV